MVGVSVVVSTSVSVRFMVKFWGLGIGLGHRVLRCGAFALFLCKSLLV